MSAGGEKRIELIGGPLDGKKVSMPRRAFVDLPWGAALASALVTHTVHNDPDLPHGEQVARYLVFWDEGRACYIRPQHDGGKR